jgi:XTP/dITP diphosphohydrolase
VLLQVVLHSRLAEERGTFAFTDVVRGITAKMIRRNPHVFRPDGSLQDTFPATVEEIVLKWDAVKKAEKPDRANHFEGIPEALPALARAQKTLDRADRAGLAHAAHAKAPVGPASPPVELAGTFTTEAELGELLLALVGVAHRKGFDAERALRGAVRHYQDQVPPGS